MSILRAFCLSILFLPFLGIAQTELDPADQKALRELEQKVTEIQEGVYQAKTRLRDLEESVLRGKVTGSKAFITFDNQAEGFFALSSAEFYVDGELVQKIDSEKRSKPIEKLQVFDENVLAGVHTLEIRLLYRGNDKSIYTVFSYFKDHKFKLEAKETFPVEYGKTTQIKLVALDKGYFKTDLGERLFLKVQTVQDWESGPAD